VGAAQQSHGRERGRARGRGERIPRQRSRSGFAPKAQRSGRRGLPERAGPPRDRRAPTVPALLRPAPEVAPSPLHASPTRLHGPPSWRFG
jgi:hypothetical protein